MHLEMLVLLLQLHDKYDISDTNILKFGLVQNHEKFKHHRV